MTFTDGTLVGAVLDRNGLRPGRYWVTDDGLVVLSVHTPEFDYEADPDNIERLRSIRRVFHTLKGSGRLVGARVLGEFSWKVENMLNRVLDGSRPASAAVVAANIVALMAPRVPLSLPASGFTRSIALSRTSPSEAARSARPAATAASPP